MLSWSNSDKSRSSCSLSSNSDSSRSSSCCLSSSCLSDNDSDSEGLENNFQPAMLGLDKEQGVISFQLEDEDYPEEVLRREEEEVGEVKADKCEEVNLEDGASDREHLVMPLLPSAPARSASDCQYSSSLRLSPLLQGRRSTLDYI